MFSSHECSVADVTEYNQLPIEVRELIARVWNTHIQDNIDAANLYWDYDPRLELPSLVPDFLREPHV